MINPLNDEFSYLELVETWGSEERIIEAARMSTGGGFRGWDKDERLLNYLYRNHHDTPFEMAGLVFEVKAPIFVFREWHRHRTQSYNEMSARYIQIPGEFYVPDAENIKERILEAQKGKNKQAQGESNDYTDWHVNTFINNVKRSYENAWADYKYALEHEGIPREIARIILPVGIYSTMRASANLRNWLGFMTLRCAPNAQWEIRQYAHAVADVIKEKFPRVYNLWVERMEKNEGEN